MNLPGLCLFYGGMLDKRNVLTMYTQCAAVQCVLTLVWLAVGYSLVFGVTGTPFLGGLDKAFMAGVSPLGPLVGVGVPEVLFAVHGSTFAAITPCLILGATAEPPKPREEARGVHGA